MYDSREHTVEAIAKTLGVSRKTIYRHWGPLPGPEPESATDDLLLPMWLERGPADFPLSCGDAARLAP